MNRLKDIPALQRDGSNLSTVMQAVQEVIQTFRGYRGDKLDKALTLRDLSLAAQRGISGGGAIDVGIIGGTTPGAPITDAYVVDPTPPPTPDGLNVSSGISSVFVSCDQPYYTQGHGHAITVVYGAKWPTSDPTQPTFSEAVELFRYQGTFSAYTSDPATRWCIWIKWQSVDGVLSTDPAGGTNGAVTTTGQDVALLLTALNGKLTSSQLHADLSTPISLISAPATTVGSVSYRLAEEAAARTSAIAAEASTRAAAILAEAGTRTTAVNDLQNQIDTVVAVTGGDLSSVIAVVQEEQAARAAADAAEATSRETLAVQMRGNYAGTDPGALTTGLLYSERQARITATETEVAERNAAIVSNLSSSEATLTALNTALLSGLTVLDAASAVRTGAERDERIAAVTSETNARISAIDAEATARLALVAVVNANAAILTSEQITRATADTANANSITTLSAQVNHATTGLPAAFAAIQTEHNAWVAGDAAEASARTTLQSTVNGNTAAISTEATTRASQTGALFAQYTVKLDVNGKVSGFGLASTGPTGAGSVFEIRAGKFAIAADTGTAAGFVPFQVLAAPTVIDGVTLPAGAYATNAFIQNLQVTNAKIAALAVDDGKVANLSAAKLTIGDGTVGGNLKSSNYIPGSAGYGWIIRQDGYAELNNVVVRGGVYASYGSFTGDVYAYNGWFRGAVNTGSYYGYAWPTDGGGGAHLSASGLLVGNANLGKYFQITSDGNIYAPNFSIVNGSPVFHGSGTFSGTVYASSGSFSGAVYASSGTFAGTLNAAVGTFSGTLTANAVNAVSTINIAGNAVTVSDSTSGNGTTSTNITVPAGVTAKVLCVAVSGAGTSQNGFTYTHRVTLNGTDYDALVQSVNGGNGEQLWTSVPASPFAKSIDVAGPATVYATSQCLNGYLSPQTITLLATFR